MHLQTAHLYAIAIAITITSTAHAMTSSTSSPPTLQPRQNPITTTNFLIGGSRTPYPAGQDSPDFDTATPFDDGTTSLILPGPWPDTVYAYMWLIDNDILRQTTLGPAYGASQADGPSYLDLTPVQCFCGQGSSCSCEENDDVGYLNMLLARAADGDDDDVVVPGLGESVSYGVTIAIRGTVSGGGSGNGSGNGNDSDSDDDDDDDDDDTDINSVADTDIDAVDSVDTLDSLSGAGSRQQADSGLRWSMIVAALVLAIAMF